MSAEFIVPGDRQEAVDLLLEKRLLFNSMQVLDQNLSKCRVVPESNEIPRLIKMFDGFDEDIEALGQEIINLEMFLDDMDMN